ncbi:MAG TPA: hypothetical protein VLI72_06020 [Methylibium sp.]|nr:hypothetical protein [Methylibium sp.]
MPNVPLLASSPLTCRAASGGEQDAWFDDMLSAYRSSGGLARVEDLVAGVGHGGGPGLALLDRWIVERTVIGFAWQADTWLPMFQFERADMTPKPSLGRVFAELRPVYDPCELADWFAWPNAWLAGHAPVSVFASDAAAVLQAARADRYIACG